MNPTKLLVIALVALLCVPTVVYANTYKLSRKGHTLVEGHSTYVVLTMETHNCPPGTNPCPPRPPGKEKGTAVAILTKETHCDYRSGTGGPFLEGVLWFNDQFLVSNDAGNGGSSPTYECVERYPCAGTIYAVNSGRPDPFDPAGNWRFPNPKYVQSYRITDPNDREWIVDLWTYLGVAALQDYVWTVNVLGQSTDLGAWPEWMDDDGFHSCSPAIDTAPGISTSGGHVPYPTIEYNGVLYMRWPHMDTRLGGSVRYGQGNADNYAPTEDGNSHPYNPYEPDAGPRHTHATAKVDVFYMPHGRPTPASRVFYINDVVGATAPFHNHP